MNPEESETWRDADLGLENTEYEVSELDREFPDLEAIGRIHENCAKDILVEYELMAIYEKF